MKNVGETLQAILKQRKLNQIQAAEKAGLTRVWFNKIIHKEDCNCSTLEKICYGLGVSPAIFFDAEWQPDTASATATAAASEQKAELLNREIELLKKLLDEKERTIAILLGEYSGQKRDSDTAI